MRILRNILLLSSIITIILGYNAFKKNVPTHVAIVSVFSCAILAVIYYYSKTK